MNAVASQSDEPVTVGNASSNESFTWMEILAGLSAGLMPATIALLVAHFYPGNPVLVADDHFAGLGQVLGWGVLLGGAAMTFAKASFGPAITGALGYLVLTCGPRWLTSLFL